jgi:hypothetical protein
MDDEGLNNTADQLQTMAWTPRVTISRGGQLPKIRTGNAAAAAAVQYDTVSSRSAAQSVGPRPGLHKAARMSSGAGPAFMEARQPLPLQPYRTDSQHAGALPPVVQLQSFQSLRADSHGGGRGCRSPMPHRRSTEEDMFGLPLRSLALPSASLSFMSPAAQLLFSPPSRAAAAKGYNSLPTSAVLQYPAQHEGEDSLCSACTSCITTLDVD